MRVASQNTNIRKNFFARLFLDWPFFRTSDVFYRTLERRGSKESLSFRNVSRLLLQNETEEKKIARGPQAAKSHFSAAPSFVKL